MSDDWRSSTVESVRSLILQAEPEMVEEVKWRKPTNPDGVPTFSCDGLVCTLETYKDKVKVTFARGASLPDPSGVFNASLDAGTRRAVDIKQDDDLDGDAFAALIREAVAVTDPETPSPRVRDFPDSGSPLALLRSLDQVLARERPTWQTTDPKLPTPPRPGVRGAVAGSWWPVVASWP